MGDFSDSKLSDELLPDPKQIKVRGYIYTSTNEYFVDNAIVDLKFDAEQNMFIGYTNATNENGDSGIAIVYVMYKRVEDTEEEGDYLLTRGTYAIGEIDIQGLGNDGYGLEDGVIAVPAKAVSQKELGSIEAALDAILEIQNSLIGGNE